ncbi:MAG: sensor histidine kinase, partial [Acidimicrobiales bacterium]
MRAHRWKLSAQVLAMQVGILVLALVVGGGLSAAVIHQRLAHRRAVRAETVAQTASGLSVVGSALVSTPPGGPGSPVARAAGRVLAESGAAAVVVVNSAGAPYATAGAAPSDLGPVLSPGPSPASSSASANPDAPVGHPTAVRVGSTTWGRAPIYVKGRGVVGQVAVEVPEVWSDNGPVAWGALVAGSLLGLAVGAALALVLGRRLERRTLGIRPGELGMLVGERETTLVAVREGVIGCDTAHRLRFVNDEACRLLGLGQGSWRPGQPLADLVPPGRLSDVLRGRMGDADVLVVVNEQVLVASHSPVFVGDRQQGAVIVLRDRTEPESLLRELDSVLGLTEALRAQAHEFSNRLHILVGLVELGRYDDAVRFVTDVSAARNELTDVLAARIGDPMVIALLLAKTTIAAERQVSLRVDPGTSLDGRLVEPGDVVTVLGNLVDNAVDATSGTVSEAGSRGAAGAGARPWVEVKLVSSGSDLVLRVADSGPGVPSGLRSSVFEDGFTTKTSSTGAQRGLGLALVRQIAEARGGSVTVEGDGGAVFVVTLPGVLETPDAEVPSVAGAADAGAGDGAGVDGGAGAAAEAGAGPGATSPAPEPVD